MSLEKYDLNHYVTLLRRGELLQSVKVDNQGTQIVQNLAYHSADVTPGTLFVCKSNDFKKEYLENAIRQGAIGYVSETEYSLEEEVPFLRVSDIRLAMALLSDTFYNSPQEKLKLIGVGGTKGKTTTVYYIKAILDEYLEDLGQPLAGLISTIAIFDGISEEESVNTTPEAMDLYRYLANAVEAGLEYVVIEVSSQALKYHRTRGLVFDIGIFLNVDEDHISPTEHLDFEDYLNAKMKMFEQTKTLLINNETKEKERILEKAKNAERYYTYSLVSHDADYFVDDLESSNTGSQFHVQSERLNERYPLSMPGTFNIENALSAVAASDLLGIPQKYVKKALREVNVPGRMSVLSTNDEKIIAVSDYAHNRLSFETLIRSIQSTYRGYKIISIFGAPGGKAFGRRQELGTVGGQYSDFVIITMDDPAYEEVEDIATDIAQYVEKEDTPFKIIANREAAIQEAFMMARDKTVILAIGKGHETRMKIKDKNVSVKSDDQIMKELVDRYNQQTLI